MATAATVPVQTFGYVANYDSNTASVIDASGNVTKTMIPVAPGDQNRHAESRTVRCGACLSMKQ